jgi:hypothetical protein
MPPNQEYQTYLREKPKLLAQGKAGKFVLIVGDRIDSVWHCQSDAMEVGYTKIYPQPFIVHRVSEVEPVYNL